MTKLTVVISTVADGSMYNRKDPLDKTIIHNREIFLKKHGISSNEATRLNPDMNRRAEVDHDTDYCRYIEVSDKQKGDGISDNASVVADAFITTEKNHALFLPVADCVGAIFYDPVKEVVMASHLGRHSLAQQGVQQSVEYLVTHFGSNPKDILVWLTPAPSKETFPIWALDNKGMKEVTFEQLDAAGILRKNITDNPIDTDKDENYFSYSEFLKGHRPEDGDHSIVAMMRD